MRSGFQETIVDTESGVAAGEYSADGDRLCYVTLGAGPAVVLLHPTPVDHRFWMPVALRLQEHYRFIIPDLRGHGRSKIGRAGNTGGISMERLAMDLESLLDELQAGSTLFVGCSIGCYVLYELWRRAPKRVRALALCCGKPQADSAATRAKRQENIAKIAKDGTKEIFDQGIRGLVASTFYQSQPVRVAELRAAMDAVTPQAEIAIQQGLLDRPDSLATVKTISAPVLALAGGEDTFSTPAEMKAISELLPAAEFYLLDRAGHFAPYEEAEVVSSALHAFFRRVERNAIG